MLRYNSKYLIFNIAMNKKFKVIKMKHKNKDKEIDKETINSYHKSNSRYIHSKKNKYKNKITRKKHLQKHLQHNYISKLINLYYDNDKATKAFLEYKEVKQHIFPEHERVIVIGDIHGDLDAAIKCLVISNCINPIIIPENRDVSNMDLFFKQLKWIGNNTYVVQLGDQIDRVRPQKWDNNEITRDVAYKDEGCTLEIFYLFYHLDKIAREHNGRVFSILGNHEIMNIDGDFRYVSLEEFKSFKDHLESIYHTKSKYPYNSLTLKKNSIKLSKNNIHSNTDPKLPKGYRERLYAFSPTGLCANMLGYNNYTVLQIGKWLFCHGSPVLKTLNKYSIDMINNLVSMYLIGIDKDNNHDNHDNNDIARHYYNITKHGDTSVLWNRDFGETELTNNIESNLSKQLDNIFAAYNTKNNKEQKHINAEPVNYVAVGHTIQDINKNGINSICNGRVWRCDVAMSRAFGNNKSSKYRKPQVLEILNGNITNVLS